MLTRLDKLVDDLVAHRERAEAESWLGKIDGKIEGIDLNRPGTGRILPQGGQGNIRFEKRHGRHPRRPSEPEPERSLPPTGAPADLPLFIADSSRAAA